MILHGDCLDLMATMEPNSVDAIVCDPPYELNFMQKKWDGTGIAFRPATWEACLRVLKPGGHLLAFGGSRTFHRIAVAIEDAGFEIRDTLSWLYASGFPKSLDVGKAIDKRGGANIAWFGPWLRQERERRGITQKELAVHFPSKTGGLTGCVANWELGFNMPTAEQFNKLCDVLDLQFDRIEDAEREVIQERTMIQGGGTSLQIRMGDRREVEANITAPATPEAAQWDGWGTALKPAWEPVIMARKPLGGTIAANVLAWGVGAINVDACRIEASGGLTKGGNPIGHNNPCFMSKDHDTRRERTQEHPAGRWPANVILDETAGELLDAMSGERKSPGNYARSTNVTSNLYGQGMGEKEAGAQHNGYGDTGGASRFYFCAKASRAERNAGLDGMPERESRRYGDRSQGPLPQQTPQAAVTMQNIHPTVKPLALCEYLVKLVTPPGGTVLDPFMGSGSIGCAATRLGFDFIGIDLEEEYVEIARARIAHWTPKASPQLALPMDAPPPPKGRWPSNVILDTDAAADLDAMSGERGNNWRKNKGRMGVTPFSGIDGSGRRDGTDGPRGHADSGGASRFFLTVDHEDETDVPA